MPSELHPPTATAGSLTDGPSSFDRGAEKEGDVFGPYRLIKRVGEGGFGVVWHAEQSRPMRRDVALKLLKRGMDTRQVLSRFEQERRVLAAMEHPCIAKILDAGVSSDGRPFFVMELLPGIPITTYCEQRKLPLRERITLFRGVCDGVQHAHQKGVIHRDLKPSNILVTEVDGRPVPKIIDFGIAKALASGEIEAMTLATQGNLVLGTPQYMSPEQIGDVGSVDTRSDIYALGAVLYELLAGQPPFAAETLQCTDRQAFWRIVRDKVPQRPSTSFTTKAVSHDQPSATPDVDVSRLPADLDWITLCALEKEPQRRYQSAAAFAADLQRFLDDEPVSAHPPSSAYIASRWIRRHQAAFAATCVSAAALVLGAGMAVWQAKIAREAQLRAESESVRSRDTAEFLTGLLAGVAAEVKKGRNPEALRQALIGSEKHLDALGNDPDLRIALITEVAALYEGMSDRKLVVPALQKRAEWIAARHGPDSQEARAAAFHHLNMMIDHGERIKAPPLLDALRDRIERHEGRGSPNWFQAQALIVRVWLKLRRYPETLAASEEAVAEARRRHLQGHPLYSVLMDHVSVLGAAGDFKEAETLAEECRAIAEAAGEEESHWLPIELNLVQIQISRGNHAGAADRQRAIVDHFRPHKEDGLNYFLELLIKLGELENRARRFEQAIAHAAEALDIARMNQEAGAEAMNDASSDTLRETIVKSLEVQASAESGMKEHARALVSAQKALLIAREGGNQTVVSRALDSLARIEEAAGNLEAAWKAHRQNYELHASHNASFKNRLDDLRQMSRIRMRQKRPAEALEHACEAWKQTIAEPSSHLEPDYLAYMGDLVLKTWKAASAKDPTLAHPEFLAACETAVRNDPTSPKR